MSCLEDDIPSFCISRLQVRNCSVLLADEVLPDLPDAVVKAEKPEVVEKKNEELREGTLLWATISKKDVLWPCILAQSGSSEKTAQYLVKFFGDSGRCGWVFRTNAVEFVGRDEELAFSNAAKDRIKRLKKPQWEVAIQEAEEFLQHPIEERLKLYSEMVEKQKASMAETAKRKREMRESQRSVKRLKLDNMREKSTELSESGISTSGSMSPCPTPDLMRSGSATPIRVTPEPKKPRKTVDVDSLFRAWQSDIKQELTESLRTQRIVCRFCGGTNYPMVRCSGRCGELFHASCTGVCVDISERPPAKSSVSAGKIEKSTSGKILCCECSDGPKICFICSKVIDGDALMCDVKFCARSFHQMCLKTWPQMKLAQDWPKSEKFRCPQHICHICSSEDLFQPSVERKERLLRCILCPTAYHNQAGCVPAGAEILSPSRIICPRHWPTPSKSLNINWCFICVQGGTLLCCDVCPGAVHDSCANTTVSDDGYICDDCESGKTLVYGDLVWAKQGAHRWWPAIILSESCAPGSLHRRRRRRGDICTYFLGSHDWTWLSRKRMFLYLEDDAQCKIVNYGKRFQNSYPKSIEEANHLSRVIKQQKLDQSAKRRPPVYRKIIHNMVIPPVKTRDMIVEKEEMDTRCHCNTKELVEKCGALSSCLNRFTQNECTDDSCSAGIECCNRRFTQRLYPATEIVRTSECGWGLVAKELVMEGDFVIEYVGDIINSQEVERRIRYKMEERDNVYYFLTLTRDLTIDAEHRGNESRFINHSCDPNCMTQKWMVNGAMRIGIFAIKDIPEGTELTFNYQWEEKRDGMGTICLCGAKKCKGFLGKSAPRKSLKGKLDKSVDVI